MIPFCKTRKPKIAWEAPDIHSSVKKKMGEYAVWLNCPSPKTMHGIISGSRRVGSTSFHINVYKLEHI